MHSKVPFVTKFESSDLCLDSYTTDTDYGILKPVLFG